MFYFQDTVMVRLWFPENGQNWTPPSKFLGGVIKSPLYSNGKQRLVYSQCITYLRTVSCSYHLQRKKKATIACSLIAIHSAIESNCYLTRAKIFLHSSLRDNCPLRTVHSALSFPQNAIVEDPYDIAHIYRSLH